MKNIVLIGFMGSGKTVVGKRLAKRLGYIFIDTDKIIEDRSGKSITEIFRQYGESYFRELEARLVKDLSGIEGHVISTGGGIVVNRENILSFKKHGFMICWLKASPETIHNRIKNQTHRPLIDVENPLNEIKRLLATREKLYAEADISVDTDGMEADKIVDIIVDAYSKSAGGGKRIAG